MIGPPAAVGQAALLVQPDRGTSKAACPTAGRARDHLPSPHTGPAQSARRAPAAGPPRLALFPSLIPLPLLPLGRRAAPGPAAALQLHPTPEHARPPTSRGRG